MDDKKLLKISVIISVIGVLSLYVISSMITLNPISIKDIDESYIGKTVLVKGKLTKIISANRTTIYIDNSQIPSTIFSKIEIAKGSNVKITGVVDEYNQNLQILVDKIELT